MNQVTRLDNPIKPDKMVFFQNNTYPGTLVMMRSYWRKHEHEYNLATLLQVYPAMLVTTKKLTL